MDEITRKWLARSRYDLATAELLLKAGRYLYVGFMCQQGIEKLLKGIMVHRGKKAVPTHNLVRLAQESGVYGEMEERWRDFLADLTPFAIEARYGDYRTSLSEIMNKRKASQCLLQTKEVLKWLRKTLR